MLAHVPPTIFFVWIYTWAGLHAIQAILMLAALRSLRGRRGIAAYALSGVASFVPVVAVLAVLLEIANGTNVLGPALVGTVSLAEILLAAITWFSLPAMLISVALDANPRRHTCSFIARVLGTLVVTSVVLLAQ